MVNFAIHSEWIKRDPISGEMVSNVPEGKKGLHLGMVETTNRQKGGKVLIPKLDSNETLARTPHGGRPLVEVELPPNVNYKEFKQVLSGAYLAYIGGVNGDEALQATGAAPTLSDVMPYMPGDLTENRVKTIMGTQAFRAACEARGIALSPRPGITPEQDYALSIILDPTAGAGLAQRLKKAKVSMAKYRAWMRNPVFKAHVQGLADGVLKEYESDMLTSLTGLAVDGDLNAIKFAFEVSGKHNPAANQVMNSRELMVQFMTIIQKHVQDPALLQAIGNDFMLLAGASGTVPSQTQPQQAQPVVIEPAPKAIEEEKPDA